MANDVSIRRYLALGGLVLELLVCPTLPGQATKSPTATSVPSEVTSWFKSALPYLWTARVPRAGWTTCAGWSQPLGMRGSSPWERRRMALGNSSK
jgi:hypothetical protein